MSRLPVELQSSSSARIKARWDWESPNWESYGESESCVLSKARCPEGLDFLIRTVRISSRGFPSSKDSLLKQPNQIQI